MTGGFTGPVYAVNPHAKTIEGVPCVASVDDLPGPVDLAVIAVPPSAVPEVATQCGRHGVGALIVITPAWVRRARNCWPAAAGMACGWSGLDVSA